MRRINIGKLHSYSCGKHYLCNFNSHIIPLILVHTYTALLGVIDDVGVAKTLIDCDPKVACCMATARALERDPTLTVTFFWEGGLAITNWLLFMPDILFQPRANTKFH